MLLDVVCSGAQLSPILSVSMDCSPSGSSVHGILQARILEWVAISYTRGSSWSGIKSMSLVSPALADGFFTTVSLGSSEWDINPTTSLLIKEKGRRWSDTERRGKDMHTKNRTMQTEAETRGATPQARGARSSPEAEEERKGPLLQTSEGAQPGQHLDFWLWTPELWDSEFLF